MGIRAPRLHKSPPCALHCFPRRMHARRPEAYSPDPAESYVFHSGIEARSIRMPALVAR
jgi:hypothetical protein